MRLEGEMRVAKATLVLAGLSMCWLLAAPAGAELPPAGSSSAAPVTLSADRLDYDSGGRDALASGDVVMEQGGMRLRTDELFWQEATGDVVATGSVKLSDVDSDLAASRFAANLVTGRAHAADGRVLLRERNFHLIGTEISRLGESTYRVTDGSFTTCDGEIPDWEFSAARVDVEVGRYATARDVWFKIRRQPLVYLPYLVFPVKTERESGFLLPRVGYSSTKGALLSLAWYQVLDRNLDATLYLDYLSRIGLGTGAEFRYLLSGDNRGEFLLYNVLGIDGNPDSYALDWNHDGRLPGGVRLAADVQYVNRREFFSDFGESLDESSRDYVRSTLLLQRNWAKLNFNASAEYIRDLREDRDDPLQRLPEAGLDLPFYRLGETPFFVRSELRADNFQRDSDADGQRVYLRQGVGAMLSAGGWLEMTPEAAVYARQYAGAAGSENDLLPELSLTLATRLQRTYQSAWWGSERFQHSIEPQVRYLYIPEHGQDDLPFFDRADRLGPLNQVEYAVVNRFTGRFSGADGVPLYRELASLRLSQAYDLDAGDGGGDDDPFSPLRAELAVSPMPEADLTIDVTADPNDSFGVVSLDAEARYDAGRGNGITAGYNYRDGRRGEPETDYLSLRLDTALAAPVYASFEERYDFVDDGNLESLLNLEYRSRCWSLFLTLRDRSDSQEVLVGFALAGLGQVGGPGSRMRQR